MTEDAVVKVRFQGCAEAGLCYPPEVRTIPLSVIAGEQVTDSASAGNALAALTANAESLENAEPSKTEQKNTSAAPKGEQSYTDKLASQGLLTNLVIFFFSGCGSGLYAVCFSDVSNFIELNSRPAKPFNEKSIFIIFCLCTRYGGDICCVRFRWLLHLVDKFKGIYSTQPY